MESAEQAMTGKGEGQMQDWFWNRRKGGSGFLRYMVLGLTFLLLSGATACGKEETGKEALPTATVTAEKGFAGANAELVERRAKEYADTIAVTVGEADITMDKAMFLIYSMEVRGNYYARYYASEYGTDYWELKYDEEGTTARDLFREYTREALVKYAVLYDCAVKNGMTLTTEEQAENNAYVEQVKKVLTAEETERGGFTTEGLREVCAWMMLAEKYYDKMTAGLEITREGVSEAVSREAYREYETEYLYLATTYYDENYELQEETEERKAAYAQQMADYYIELQNGVTFEEIAEAEERIVHETRTFLAEGGEAEKAYAEAAGKLAVGEISEPVQTEYGIYLIKMLDDNCTKSYEAAVDAAYEAERSKAFEAAYQVLLAEYPVEFNEEVWKEIVLGATVSLME